eukprot:261005_1
MHHTGCIIHIIPYSGDYDQQILKSNNTVLPVQSEMSSSFKWLTWILFLFSYATHGQTPVDPLATKETKCLYKNLYDLTHSSTQFIFGHHHDNFEGQNFRDKTGLLNESDVQTDTKYFPGFIEYNLNSFLTNGVNFTNHILNAISKGLMIGWHWEATNPVTGGSDKDTSGNPIVELMPNHSANKNWTHMLDIFANFVKTIRLPNGNPVPMVFRPLHEMLGDWYWWGQNYCTSQQYIDAYNYTQWYLVEKHDLHNLLFVFAPNKPYSYYGDNVNKYITDRYPGDKNIDVIAMDCYDQNDFHEELINNTKLVVKVSQNQKKIAAIAEFGVRSGVQNTNISSWFMSAFYTPLFKDDIAWKIGFVNTWADASSSSYWVPLKGQTTYNSFIEMFQQNNSVFENNIKDLYYSC